MAQFVEVAGSIHSNFSWTHSFRQHCVRRAIESVTEMSNRYISGGGGGVKWLTELPPLCAMS